ncbi:hypothetical protein [Nocardia seriolae]|nr:hypothetical protein [Nocardia seriolae]APA98750.1 hypothetical protein NS506_04704 [Nocardia seriolae]MTJ63823.1 hypothetical protein [Nocardia seriolae]MTJ72284.1 hypothetical protein [Nocardia seriolae]MTJ88383.1 hypothetical protein [Nocardia seriolae]MTK32368.1 hypothetical protein [Nocardia seriolae]
MLFWAGESLFAVAATLDPENRTPDSIAAMVPDHVLDRDAIAFGVVSVLLLVATIFFLCRLRFARLLLIGAAALAVVGQLEVTRRGLIPIFYFFHHPPRSNVVSDWPLLLFPLITIALLLGSQREY